MAWQKQPLVSSSSICKKWLRWLELTASPSLFQIVSLPLVHYLPWLLATLFLTRPFSTRSVFKSLATGWGYCLSFVKTPWSFSWTSSNPSRISQRSQNRTSLSMSSLSSTTSQSHTTRPSNILFKDLGNSNQSTRIRIQMTERKLYRTKNYCTVSTARQNWDLETIHSTNQELGLSTTAPLCYKVVTRTSILKNTRPTSSNLALQWTQPRIQTKS